MEQPQPTDGGQPPIIIKKYANRRLYSTESSRYVTLEDLARMVKQEIEFVVTDVKSGEDITRFVLAQIIMEEEHKGNSLLPQGFLRQLIQLYGDGMRWLFPSYLEQSVHSFRQSQEQLRDYFQAACMYPFGNLEDLGKRQLAIIEQAAHLFDPILKHPTGSGRSEGIHARGFRGNKRTGRNDATSSATLPEDDDSSEFSDLSEWRDQIEMHTHAIGQLEQQLEQLQRQLQALRSEREQTRGLQQEDMISRAPDE